MLAGRRLVIGVRAEAFLDSERVTDDLPVYCVLVKAESDGEQIFMGLPSLVMLATTLAAKDGGIARSVPRLAMAVAELGTPVTLVAPLTPAPAIDPRSLHGVEVLTASRWSELKALIRQTVDATNNNLLAYHAGIWSPANHYFAKVARKRGVPYIASPRSMLDPWALEHKPLRKRIAWFSYARHDVSHSTFIHATSDLEASHLESLNIVVPVYVIPHGIDMPPAALCATDRVATEKSKKRVLFLSRLHPKKGLEDLLLAFGAINREEWELVVVGSGHASYEARLRQLAATLPCFKDVHFAGEATDREKWAWYQSADLFVLPSYSENFGLVIAESLAAGVPVLTTTATPWGALITRKCGWCVLPGPSKLREALSEAMMLSDATLKSMGARGRNWMLERFSWGAVAARFTEACRLALDGGAALRSGALASRGIALEN